MGYMNTPDKQYTDEWDANTGWWAEKPARLERSRSFATFERGSGGVPRVWRDAVLVVGAVFALIYSVVALAAR